MAIPKDFKNAVPDQNDEEPKAVEELEVLKESDARTIYNLIFSEKKGETSSQTQKEKKV